MPIDSNGIPALDNVTNIDTASQNELLGVDTPQVTIGSMVERALAEFDNAGQLYLDVAGRKLYCAEGEDIGAFVAALADEDHQHVVSPDPGQSGRSLTWTAATPGASADDELDTYVKSVVDAVKPRRTVGSLVNAILGAIPDDNLTYAPKGVLIDQVAGTVTLLGRQASVPTENNLIDAVEGAAKGLTIAFSEPPDTGSSSPLKFEGGAV